MRRNVFGITIAGFCTLFGCSNLPVGPNIGNIAEGFKYRRPATAAHELGKQRHQGTFDNATCYSATQLLAAAGPKNIQSDYAGQIGGDLRIDGGRPLLTAVASLSKVTVSSVTIKESEETSLDGIYFLPNSICAETNEAEYARPNGAKDEIAAKALRAKEIHIWGTDTNNAGVSLTWKDQGGKLVLSSGTSSIGWDGDNLYFAYKMKRVTTRKTPTRDFPHLAAKKPTENIDGDICQINVNGQLNDSWSGNLLCIVLPEIRTTC